MITRVEYLRLSTLLPIVTPVLLFIPITLGELAELRMPAWLGSAAAVSFSAILMFGIPYAAVVGVALALLWRRSWKAHLAAAFVAPLCMVAAVGIFLRILAGPEAWGEARTFALWCVGVGYSYVAIAIAGMWVLARAGRLTADGPSSWPVHPTAPDERQR